MSRPPQALRKNVSVASSQQRHRRQEQQQNHAPPRVQQLQMQPIQPNHPQQQQHLPVDDYYYEEMQQEQFCCGDYEHEAPIDAEECCSAQPTSQQIDAARRGDVTELYRRRCPSAEVYSYQPQYQDELVVHPSQPISRVQMPHIHNAPNILRKRVLPVSANVSYHQFAMPSTPATLQPTPVLQAKLSQTQYIPNDENMVLKQQVQAQQYEQLLQARNRQMQLHRQQQLHMQRQRQFQQYQNQQHHSQYNLINQSNQTPQNLQHKHHMHVPQDTKLFRLHNGGYEEYSAGSNVETRDSIAQANVKRAIPLHSGSNMTVLDPRTEKKVQTSARLCSDITYQGSLEEKKIRLDDCGNNSRTTIANGNEINVRESDSKRRHNASKSVMQGIGQARRHPITVRTPRYIRRAITPSLYKRPSALCIPLAVQPDPALFVTPSNTRKLKRDAQVQNNQKSISQSQVNSPRKIPIKHLPLAVTKSFSNSPRNHQQGAPRVYDNSHENGMITRSLSKINARQVNGSVQGQAGLALNDMGLPKSTQDRLDSIFQRYDNLFRDMVPSGDGKYIFSERSDNARTFENIDKFDKFENLERMSKLEKFDPELLSKDREVVDVYKFKPRVPPCMKDKPTGIVKENHPDMIKEADTLQVEEMTTDMLDELLKELTKQGLNEIASAEEKKNQAANEEHERLKAINKLEEEKYVRYLDDKKRSYAKSRVEKTQAVDKDIKECPVKDLPKSFTYSDIKQSMSRPIDDFPEDHQILQNISQTSKALDPILVEPGGIATEREHDRVSEQNSEGDQGQTIILSDREREKDQEIKQEQDFKQEKEKDRQRHQAQKQESDGDISSKKSVSSTTTTSAARSGAKIIPRILVDDAMELHRTKSYVVNLIDTALSNHFNTMKDLKHKHKEKMHNKNTIQMLKKQNSTTSRSSSKGSQKDLVDEIAHVLDTFGCNSRHSNVTKDSSQCSCKSSHEEPMFVKQLRQMRWGHLKHIQQEVRRLEELERFLDSCNLSTFEKCHYH